MTAIPGAAAPVVASPPARARARSTAAAPATAAASSLAALPEVSAPAETSDDRNLTLDREAALQARRSAALLKQQQQFNFFAMEHAQLARERQTIADLFAAQNKHNDDEVDDWIRRI